MKNRFTRTFALILAASLPAVSLADDKEATKTETKETKKPDVTLTVTGNDTMQFDKTKLEVTQGQVVKIVFKNIGKLPKNAMGHNLVLLKPGTKLPDFSAAATKHKDKEYIPQDEKFKKTVIGFTKVLGPGEEASFTFTAGDPGDYPYLCSFPGHFAIMKGVLTVKAK